MTAWWLSDDCLMLFWWLPNYWLRAANFPMPVQWLHDPKHLNQLSPDSKVLKRIQILLSGESWRVDLGSRAAAGTAAAAAPPPPPPPQTVRTVATGVGPLTLHSSSVQKNCRKSSVFLPWVLCALYQHYRHFQICAMPWVPGAVGTDCLSKGKNIYALVYDHTTVQRNFDYLEFFQAIVG